MIDDRTIQSDDVIPDLACTCKLSPPANSPEETPNTSIMPPNAFVRACSRYVTPETLHFPTREGNPAKHCELRIFQRNLGRRTFTLKNLSEEATNEKGEYFMR